MVFICLLLLALLVHVSLKCFSYCCALRGLLYYLAMEYDELLSEKKAKELTRMATERTIKEFFGKC